MSADLLREAASDLRAMVNGVSADSGLVSDPDFKLAVADWLEEAAESWRLGVDYSREALAVARAYLGRDA